MCALSVKKPDKSLWKGAWGDSPQCGEMSHSDRGARLRQREPFLRKVSPINKYKLLYKYYG